LEFFQKPLLEISKKNFLKLAIKSQKIFLNIPKEYFERKKSQQKSHADVFRIGNSDFWRHFRWKLDVIAGGAARWRGGAPAQHSLWHFKRIGWGSCRYLCAVLRLFGVNPDSCRQNYGGDVHRVELIPSN